MFSCKWQLWLLLLAAVLFCGLDSQDTTDPAESLINISLTLGPILGQTTLVQSGTSEVPVVTYWGIPYAQPPTGDLRFKAPQAHDAWTEVRSALEFPKPCVQSKQGNTTYGTNQMSEDCLYLNVWRPVCNETPMAIMVWFHGGSLRTGFSGEHLYNGEHLAARECVIVITVNYRLGPLGFLYSGTDEAPGNMGLLDLRQAVSFIKDNAENFGATPDKVTLFGSGSGAFIVSTFLMSNTTTHLFGNAILQSGNPEIRLLHQSTDSALESSKELAKLVNCSIETLDTMLTCMREVDADVLVDKYNRLQRRMIHRLVSITDGSFLQRDPLDHLTSGNFKQCPILLGTNKDEGTESLIKILPSVFSVSNPAIPVVPEQVVDMLMQQFLGLLYRPVFVPFVITVVKLVYDWHKLKNQTDGGLTFLSTLISDMVYTCPMYKLAEKYSKTDYISYVYSFEHPPDSQDPAWLGATHAAEIPFVFRTTDTEQPPAFTPEEEVLSATMQKMWANFAKHSNPTPTPGLQWPLYTPKTSERLIRMYANTSVAIQDAKNLLCTFWNIIPAEMRT